MMALDVVFFGILIFCLYICNTSVLRREPLSSNKIIKNIHKCREYIRIIAPIAQGFYAYPCRPEVFPDNMNFERRGEKQIIGKIYKWNVYKRKYQ